MSFGTPGSQFIEKVNLESCDLSGDGNHSLILRWYGRFGPGNNPGTILILDQAGLVERSINVPWVQWLAVLDRDDDGRREIATGFGDGVALFDSEGQKVWQHKRVLGDAVWGRLTAPRISVADLDGDGVPWIVAAASDASIFVFDVDGNLRPGWPLSLPEGTNFLSAASSFDLDGDGRSEILVGEAHSRVYCLRGDGSACPGWPYIYDPNGSGLSALDHSPVTIIRNESAIQILATSAGGTPRAVHLIDAQGAAIAPYPMLLPAAANSVAVFDDGGSIRAAFGRYQTTGRLVTDVETGATLPGWPTPANEYPSNAASHPVVGEIGPNGSLGILFQEEYYQTTLAGYDFSGQPLPGFPRSMAKSYSGRSMTLGTLDGRETTACWAGGTWSGDTGLVECIDLGVPWDRSKVQWGNYGFDVAHTGFFRRLYQIDRANTCLVTPVSEISSISGVPFEVTVCPHDGSDSPLGPDQEVRIVRRPVLGRFEGATRYDPTTGNYSRTFVPPVQEDGAEIEFRVLVNDELDDTMPVVRLRGRPRVMGATRDLVARGSKVVTELSAFDFSPAPGAQPTTPDLLVQGTRILGPDRLEVTLRAPASARVGWSGVQVVSSDGRASNAWPVFVFDAAETTLVATEGAGEAADLEWPGGAAPGPPGWRLERSARADFGTASTLYVGPGREFVDTGAAASGVWFYRVR